MRILFLLLTTFLLVFSCKGNDKKSLNIDEKELSAKDSIITINSVDQKLIQNEIKEIPKDQLLKWYKLALERDFERPYMWDTMIPENSPLLKFYHYKKIKIQNKLYNTIYVNIRYEDGQYEGILLIMDDKDFNNENKSLLIYENLDSEEKYQRITHEENNLLYTALKRNGNTYKKLYYTIQGDFILDYFENNGIINKSWGNIEEIESDSGIKGEAKEYLMKGEIKENKKNGNWEERQYSVDYDKSIWMNGRYINGVRDGEWNLSPNGSVDKVLIYKKGQIIKSYNP